MCDNPNDMNANLINLSNQANFSLQNLFIRFVTTMHKDCYKL